MNAGAVIVFSTNLMHETRLRTEDYPRLNIFQRYQLSVYFNETGKGGYSFDGHRGQLSEVAYGLESLTREEKVCLNPNN